MGMTIMDAKKCVKCGKIPSGSKTWDCGKGGTDRDLDNDDVWNFDKVRTDRGVAVPF
jgi:hypothetical protein